MKQEQSKHCTTRIIIRIFIYLSINYFTVIVLYSIKNQRTMCTYLSTAIATRVKTDADTDTPCTKPLILHTVLEKGQPVKKATSLTIQGNNCPSDFRNCCRKKIEVGNQFLDFMLYNLGQCHVFVVKRQQTHKVRRGIQNGRRIRSHFSSFRFTVIVSFFSGSRNRVFKHS